VNVNAEVSSTTTTTHAALTAADGTFTFTSLPAGTDYQVRSNSRSEGYNRLAKHQGSNAFGFRNPVNQRRRLRYACTRQYRRASAARSTLPA